MSPLTYYPIRIIKMFKSILIWLTHEEIVIRQLYPFSCCRHCTCECGITIPHSHVQVSEMWYYNTTYWTLLYSQFLYVFKITDLELAKLELNRETERLQGQSNDNSTQLDQLSAELTETKQLLQERDGSIIVLQQQIDTQVLSLKLLYI